MTIRDEERSQRVVTRLTQKDFTAMETSLKNSIQKTEKQRKIRYKKVRKTIKAMIVEEKQRDKELKQAEKKLRKTLRQQGEYKEEIKHELIQGLVGKYQTRIKDDLVDLGAQTEAAEREEVERLAEKQRMKDERVREKLVEREHKQKERQEIREQKNRERAETREQKQRERDAKRKTKKNNK
jgi:hypothetical protein